MMAYRLWLSVYVQASVQVYRRVYKYSEWPRGSEYLYTYLSMNYSGWVMQVV